jgi:hypothetical protein
MAKFIPAWLRRFWAWLSHLETAASVSGAVATSWSSALTVVGVFWGYIQHIPGPYLLALGTFLFASISAGFYYASKWRGAVKIVASMEASDVPARDRLPVYPVSTIDPMESVFKEKTIYIADLLGDGMDRIQGKRFEKCRLIGPGVAYFRNASFEYSTLPDVRESWVYLTENVLYQGIFLFERCVFERCEFSKIDFAGSDEMRQHMVKEVKSDGHG